MEDPRPLVGLVLFVGGAVGARYAHVLAKWDEQMDAIGSKRRLSEVEPAMWKVTFVLLSCAASALVGALLLVVSII
ncbi:hypothetical protein [Halorussus amylolyticus]|uniref:hypothetical protein n=1 Tax=Halorussus amylolyticus TaxID=1126242 RepID=UPI00104E03DD|nr:hypothetical protein [Halorussus amylolyticus]